MLFLLICNTNNFDISHHPIHVSITNIDYKANKQKFIFSFKFFTDDFEAIIYRDYNIALNLNKRNEYRKAEKYFTKFINNNFYFNINKSGKTLKNLKFVKRKYNHEAIWLLYEYNYNKPIKTIEIYNNFFNNFFGDQTNLLIFKYQNAQKGFRFDKNKTKEIIKMNN